MITPRNVQTTKDADAKAVQGDYAKAINLYEAALDDTPASCDIHYKLGLLYDDKLNEPLSAVHHFKRYLALNPTGPRATEVKQFIKRDELVLLTSLSGDEMVTRNEAARLRNENLNLRRQLDDRSGKAKLPMEKGAPGKTETTTHPDSYVVEPGDTLFSISRKFYQSSRRWKDIRDANKGKIDNPARLKPGETLRLP